jgi:glutathione S-transferase
MAPPPRSDVTLYFDPLSASTARVATALHEKQVDFERRPIDVSAGEQFQPWFLELTGSQQLPILRHDDRHIADGVGNIMTYVDENFGRPCHLYPSGEAGEAIMLKVRAVDAIPIDLISVGIACFWPEGVTERLKSPLCDEKVRRERKAAVLALPEKLSRLGLEGAEVAAAEAELLRDRERTVLLLDMVESVLDDVEATLAADDRVGIWLCGLSFSAADAALACLLFRLDTLGLDESLWKGGRRPHITVYQVRLVARFTES